MRPAKALERPPCRIGSSPQNSGAHRWQLSLATTSSPARTGPTIVGGDGCWLITDDGRRILDAAGGAMVVNIGHGRTVVADAVREALDGGAYVVPIWSTPHRERLHDVLAERWLPAGMGNVFFTSGGSESADSARAPGAGAPRRGGSAGAVEGRRAPSQLPRDHAGGDGRRQPQRSP